MNNAFIYCCMQVVSLLDCAQYWPRRNPFVDDVMQLFMNFQEVSFEFQSISLQSIRQYTMGEKSNKLAHNYSN